VVIPEDQSFHPRRGDFDLSNDGSLLVYRGVGDEGQPQLWARQWDALDATPVRDTDGAGRPAISPDGREVAFNVGNGVIRVVPLPGGVSRTLTDSAWFAGGPPQWSPDGGWIYFTNPSQGLSRLPAGGGIAEIVTVVDTTTGYSVHVSVEVLPGDAAVYHASPLNPLSGVVPTIQAVDSGTEEVKDLTAGRHPRYSSTGHLLFQDPREGILLVASFDAVRLELTGEPFPLADGLLVGGNSPVSFTFSQTGRLVYCTGTIGEAPIPVWVERDGSAREIDSG
jgi:Tol biopolymer transport system component